MSVGGLSRAQRAVRLALVLVVLGAEFWFLLRLYHLDDRVDAQQVAYTQVATAVDAHGPGDGAGTVDRGLAALTRSGAPGAPAVSALSRAWLRSADPADRARLGDALDATGSAIHAQQSRTDQDVVLSIAALFLVVCVGWFTWFNRLARRHRRVQDELTERRVVDAGERRLTALVHNSADVVMTLDGDSTATFVSPAARAVLGVDPRDLVGRRLVDRVAEEDRGSFVRLLTGSRGGEQAVSMRMRHADGRTLVVEATLSDLRDDPAVACWVLTARDITQRSRLEDELTHQAFHDSLTGLANRQLFADRLVHALARPAGPTSALAVLFLDLDDFKLVNDGLGHEVGDQLLIAVSERLAGALREHDTAARLGGDEFAVLLEGCDEEAATQVAEQLLATLAEPIVLEGVTHAVRASIGIATAVPGEVGDNELLRNADAAMYLAKERGKGSLAVYDPSLHVRAMDLLATRIELRQAIAGDELVLHYQPTVDLTTQAITGFEALVRWDHPRRGLLPPAEFIGVAEQAGLIVALGTWVLRHACHAGRSMQTEQDHPTLSVNVAAQQLSDPAFPEIVLGALADSGLAPERLVLEITESALLDDVETSVAALSHLRAYGVRVAIDDFGTGYSSLSNLSRLPVDVLKVDKSFVDRLGVGADDTSVVEAIIAMSAALDLVMVAEGVEQEEQARWLHAHGSALGQGFLWSRPVELTRALALLHAGLHRELDPPEPPERTCVGV